MKQNIVIGSDHAGFDLKDFFKTYLSNEGFNVKDVGTNSHASCDYPDIADKVAEHIRNNPDDLGILICGTGVGMSMAVNRYPFIRGALLYNIDEAKLARQHNKGGKHLESMKDANVIVFAGRMFENKENLDFLNAFLSAEFSNEERHKQRIKKLSKQLTK